MMTKVEAFLETLRAVDYKSADHVALHGYISEIRAMIDSEEVSDLSERVQLLRIWHALSQMHQKIAPPLTEISSDVEILAESAPVDAAIDAKFDIVVERRPRGLDGEADPTTPRDAGELGRIDPTQRRPAGEVEYDGSISDAPHSMPQDDRIRLRLIKEGLLENQVLPVGTVVLVHPTDASHLLDENIAVIVADSYLID